MKQGKERERQRETVNAKENGKGGKREWMRGVWDEVRMERKVEK